MRKANLPKPIPNPQINQICPPTEVRRKHPTAPGERSPSDRRMLGYPLPPSIRHGWTPKNHRCRQVGTCHRHRSRRAAAAPDPREGLQGEPGTSQSIFLAKATFILKNKHTDFSRWHVWGFGLSRREEKHSRNVAGTRAGKATALAAWGRGELCPGGGNTHAIPRLLGIPRRFVTKPDVLQQPRFTRQKGGRFCNLCHYKNKSTGTFLLLLPCNLAKNPKQLVKQTKATSATAGDTFRITSLLSTKKLRGISKHNR